MSNKSYFAPDPKDSIVAITFNNENYINLSNAIVGSRVLNNRNPYNLNAPPMPRNYLDFLNLMYVSISNGTVDQIPYFNRKLNYWRLKDLSQGKGYSDYCLTRRGLKYFTFLSYAQSTNNIQVFFNIQHLDKEYINSATELEKIFSELNYALQTDKSKKLPELLEKNFNNSTLNMISTITKMEEILKMSIGNSNLNNGYNYNNGYNNSNSCPSHSQPPVDEFFGKHHHLYGNLVRILEKTNELLENPRIPEGMVSRGELLAELSKILPGINEDQLDKILSRYSTKNDVEVALVNYVLKTDFETRLTAYLLKSDTNQFATREMLLTYASKSDLVSQLANFYEKNVIDVMIRGLSTKDEVDTKLANYLKKSDYIPFNGYTKQEVDLMLTNYITKKELSRELESYISAKTLDQILENYLRKDWAREFYLSRKEANEIYAKKSEISSGGADLSNYATKAEVDEKINLANQMNAKFTTIPVSEDCTCKVRKSLMLNNHDTISGYKSNGEEAVNLIMCSKWDKVDIGSTQVPLNLNGSEERPTYNDEKPLALYEDVENLKTYVDQAIAGGVTPPEGGTGIAPDLSTYATKEEVAAIYATKTEVDEKIAQASLGGDGSVDLSTYAKTADVEANYLKKTDAESTYATKAEVQALQEKITALEGRIAALESPGA